MQRTFDHLKYRQTSWDLEEKFGPEDEFHLRQHHDRFARFELRGTNPLEYFRIEAAFFSKDGDILLAGWADRSLVAEIQVDIEIGYSRYHFGVVEPCWYFRPDVSELCGDFQSNSGFIVLLHIEDLIPHSRVEVYVNHNRVWGQENTRWLACDRFLNQALGAAAVLADQPVAGSIHYAEKVHERLADVWARYLERLRPTCALRHGRFDDVRVSVVIVLYRKAEMLLMQLKEFAHVFTRPDVEVVVVANELVQAQKTVDEVWGLLAIQEMNVSIHLVPGNSGFSAANNFGAELAAGDTVVFMNPDIFPLEGETEESLRFFIEDPGEKLVGALMYYGNGSLMHSGMFAVRDRLVDTRTGDEAQILRVEHFGKGSCLTVDDPAAAALPAPEDAGGRMLVSAALWKIKRNIFLEVGGLPTDYIIAYYEDADFCLQLLENGYEIEIDPTAKFLHLEGVQSNQAPAVRSFMWLNRYIFSRRFADSSFVVDTAADMRLL